MKSKQLDHLFQAYISAFKHYDLSAVQACYQLPCTLHTPDKIAYIANNVSFKQEFDDIFTVLRHANTENIIATKATYSLGIDDTIDVCIDWAFIDKSKEVFADFCAFYHLVKVAEQYKIISVVSHDLSNSVALTFDLAITN
ncbi:MAG: hypothetical protein HRT53_11690 [Colwellia sp.]|nr:hypothetical protein [Colwellia sp.]